jgi:CBS domain-containing protein
MKYQDEHTIREIMTSSPVTLQADNSLNLADEIMELGRVRHVPILEGHRLVGVLSQSDLFHSAFAKAMGFRPGEQRELLNSIPITEVMSKPVISVGPDSSIRAAARLMMEKKVGCLPVVEGEKLVGLVTKNDMLRYLAKREEEDIAPVVVDISC